MLCLTQVHVHSFINQKQLNAILYFLERIPSDNRLDGIVTKLEKVSILKGSHFGNC